MTSEERALRKLVNAGVAEGAHVEYGPEPEQFLELFGDAASATRLVVFVHGGYFRPETGLAHARPLASSLAGDGALVALLEYRREGGHPLPLRDVTSGISHVLRSAAAWGVPRAAAGRPIVAGHSAGGSLVLSWASHLGAAGMPVVLRPLAPVTNLVREAVLGLAGGAVREYMGAHPDEDPARYLAEDPRSRAALIPSHVDVRLLHGTGDRTVDIAFSREFPADRVELAGAHHFDLVDPRSRHFPRVRRELLGEPSAGS